MLISLHPENGHYFLFRGKPTVLVGSGEHYGAVLNADFNYVPYLDELRANGLNLTRTFTGVYCEPTGAFKIADNTLAPAKGKLLCPWARSATPGYANGGNKFDLDQWDEAYFRRLKEFVAQAGQRGIVVELVLFCPYYDDSMWELSPLNARNNTSGLGDLKRTEANTLHSGKLLEVQRAMVRKIVTELREADNVYYEICNEPYFGGVTIEWQHRIAEAIVEAEKDFPRKHLIAQNIANGKAKVDPPHPAVSIFNFHYAFPPETVALNYGLNRVLADDETGFKGTGDSHYRREGWEFMLAGGGAYSNLDYSFTTGHPEGTFQLPPQQPGGGGRTLRRQLAILKRFLEGFDFVRMKPDDAVVTGGTPKGGAVRVLAESGKAYAVYVCGGPQAALTLTMPAGRYEVRWVNTLTGAVDKSEQIRHAGGKLSLTSPPYTEDVALSVRVTGDDSPLPPEGQATSR